jgi:hypothetical protein
MTTPLRLNEVLARLAPEQIREVIDFAEFLADRVGQAAQKHQEAEQDHSSFIYSVCGKYRDALSSSEELAQRKPVEIALEC